MSSDRDSCLGVVLAFLSMALCFTAFAVGSPLASFIFAILAQAVSWTMIIFFRKHAFVLVAYIAVFTSGVGIAAIAFDFFSS